MILLPYTAIHIAEHVHVAIMSSSKKKKKERKKFQQDLYARKQLLL